MLSHTAGSLTGINAFGASSVGSNAYTVESCTADELAKFLKTDTEKWEAVIKTTGIKID
jgi:hypothetical protein